MAINVDVSEGPVLQAVRFVRGYWPALVPLLLLLRFFYYKYASPLRQYPGPFLASGSRLWKVISTYRGKTEQDHIKIHERYGMLKLLGPFITCADRNQVPLSASHRTSSLYPRQTLLEKSWPQAKGSVRPTSMQSFRRQRTQISSPRHAKQSMPSRNAMLRTRTP
jgi:hypothetical protein